MDFQATYLGKLLKRFTKFSALLGDIYMASQRRGIALYYKSKMAAVDILDNAITSAF